MRSWEDCLLELFYLIILNYEFMLYLDIYERSFEKIYICPVHACVKLPLKISFIVTKCLYMNI